MIKISLKKIKNKGFVLLFAVTLAAIFLSIALGIASVALKEVNFSTSAKNSNDAFFAADTGVECALYYDKLGAFVTGNVSQIINCNSSNVSVNESSSSLPYWNFNISGLDSGGQGCTKVTVDKTVSNTTTITASGYNQGGGSAGSCSPGPNNVERVLSSFYSTSSSSPDNVWVEDGIPGGGNPGTDGGDSWTWVPSNPAPFSGSSASQSNIASGEHQHYFYGANPTLNPTTGDTMIAYVYLDPANPPSEVELQWTTNEQGWSHRAFWSNSGTDQIGFGAQGTQSLYYMGTLPTAGQWVELKVPASDVGLEGLHINGMAFTLYGGRATWDHVGMNP
jgi:hypothetical protein